MRLPIRQSLWLWSSPILHRYWDTTTYWLKITIFLPLSHSAPSLPILMFPLELKPDPWGYPAVKTTWSSLSHFDTVPACNRRTDRQTDRGTDRQTDGFTIAMCNWTNHCLHHLLASERDTGHDLRQRGHSYQLVCYNFSCTRHCFVIRVLYDSL